MAHAKYTVPLPPNEPVKTYAPGTPEQETMKTKLRKENVRSILQLAFPEYHGRTFELEYQSRYYPQDYWSGGTRYYFKVLEFNGNNIKIDWRLNMASL